jgi:prolyl-tRNA synthetase
MQPEEIQEVFGAPAGFLGPVGGHHRQFRGIKAKVLVDRALLGRKNLIAGANKQDYHLRNVTPGRDFTVAEHEWADLRSVAPGEACPNCGNPLKVDKAVEIGHIFKLGTKYSESMGARVLDQNGKEVTMVMGCYGIGIERILTAAIEQNHDENGFWLPASIAPFEVVVVPTNVREPSLLSTAEEIAQRLESRGFDVLLDDRDERPGVKFKDADLVGIPVRINVGKKVTDGAVEVVQRSTRESRDASIRDIEAHMEGLLRSAR